MQEGLPQEPRTKCSLAGGEAFAMRMLIFRFKTYLNISCMVVVGHNFEASDSIDFLNILDRCQGKLFQ